jgi:hypothetical protein
VNDIPKSLKAPNKREGGKRLHIIVMNERGKTSRFTFSTTFFWIMGFLAVAVLGSLFLLANRLAIEVVEREGAKLELKSLADYYELKDFNRALAESPKEAGLILERLDRAALLAETLEDEPVLPWEIDTETDALAGNAPEPNASGADPAPASVSAAAPETVPEDPALGADPAAGPEIPGAPDPENPAPNLPASKDEGPPGEAEIWAAFQSRLPGVTAEGILDVDDFRVTPAGNYSYQLKNVASEGGRLRGRAIAVFAVADASGAVSLVPDPVIDLAVPSQGYDRGGKYNIISSKEYRGAVKVPQGGQILSARVLAWDEATRELVFQKRIVIGRARD